MTKYFLIIIVVSGILFSCNSGKKESSRKKIKPTTEELMDVNRLLVKKDSSKIAGYVHRKGWDMKETQTGLWYMIYHKGNGAIAHKGQLAIINYKVSLLNGTACYSSGISGPKQFKIGQGGVESGLEEGILLLHVGDKARFIMPPHLAYGLIGDDNKIPARAIIVYDVEVIDFRDIN
jgi:FKBP-type peptidyl-prolyl cis-trans isomerase